MIYFDNNATTKILPNVLDKMLPFLQEDYGNASSIQHKLGRISYQAVEQSRNYIAQYFNTQPKEIFFTTGSTESANWIIKGIFKRYQPIGKHIITCKTEHKAILSTCEYLERNGAEITYLDVDHQGNINLIDLENSIRKDTILITLMSANNETGVIHPIVQIAEICTKKNVLFFCDATQSIGKQEIDLVAANVDVFCFSAHKFHGPKGVGGVFIKRKSKPIQIEPLIFGGKQENNLRAGTYNTSQIVGLAEAIRQIEIKDIKLLADLRDYFEEKIIREIPDCKINGIGSNRISNTSNICFKHVPSNQLMVNTPNLAISSGSACVSGDKDPSHVLTAMHITSEDALSSIRFSFSKLNTHQEIDLAINDIKIAVHKIRSESPIWQMYKKGLL